MEQSPTSALGKIAFLLVGIVPCILSAEVILESQAVMTGLSVVPPGALRSESSPHLSD